MKALLIQPEDSGRSGPWTRTSWDMAVDLGRVSQAVADEWSYNLGCPLIRLTDFVRDIEDIREAGRILAAGDGQLMDDEGIDWWNLWSLDILRDTAAVLALQRVSQQIPQDAELYATRPGWPADALAKICAMPLRAYRAGLAARGRAKIAHQIQFLRHFSAAQIKEIALDKYDSRYRVRVRFETPKPSQEKPVVLIPSAYTNVSRVAADYARLLPAQPFLVVATRRSAHLFDAPANVQVRDLAAYAKGANDTEGELRALQGKWKRLRAKLLGDESLAVLHWLGLFDSFQSSISQGLAVRNAWRAVLDREPVRGVLCGDDTNTNTRLPVLLAAQRGLPTVDFHHGAMDGFYLAKRLASDVYLAKSEMERDYLVNTCGLPTDRVTKGAPNRRAVVKPAVFENIPTSKAAIVFFSEPYENMGMRAQEVYCEVLPALCSLGRETGRGIILKLHPFEAEKQRSQMARSAVSATDRKRITLVSGPLTEDLLQKTWVGITVESSTVLDCAIRGIPCFLCGWLALSPFGYLQQYAKFGAGEFLGRVEDISLIPKMIGNAQPDDDHGGDLQRSPSPRNFSRENQIRTIWEAAEPRQLELWLTGQSPKPMTRGA